ncbi:hypothetical protein M885DRAFT_543715 [Pelagophyceae sp. CCMP2097]|nr:hypothetical protein M885DRAFT_543715 [Pelagophyceae sp. CCMP2097]
MRGAAPLRRHRGGALYASAPGGCAARARARSFARSARTSSARLCPRSQSMSMTRACASFLRRTRRAPAPAPRLLDESESLETSSKETNAPHTPSTSLSSPHSDAGRRRCAAGAASAATARRFCAAPLGGRSDRPARAEDTLWPSDSTRRCGGAGAAIAATRGRARPAEGAPKRMAPATRVRELQLG